MSITEEGRARARWPGLGRLAAAWRSGPLGGPGFRLLAFGQFASTIGDYCYAVALPWLVLSGGGSTASLGIVLACYGIPRALLTVPGGALTDRFSPRLVMLSADFARCALTAVLAGLAAAHVSSVAALAPVAVLLGCGAALFVPASMTMVPTLVEPSGLTAANSVYVGFYQAGSMLGPLLGGALVAAAGPASAFAVDAGSYLVSAITLGLIPVRPRVTAPAAAPSAAAEPSRAEEPARAATAAEACPAADAAGGAGSAPLAASVVPGSVWQLLRQSRVLQILLIVVLSANFALYAITEVALPALAHARFGAGGYGAVLTCVAVAALAGALTVGKLGDRFRPVMVIAVAILAAGAAIAAVPFLGGLPGAAAGMAVFGVALGFDNVMAAKVIQRWAPPAMLGRVWGLLTLASAGSFPVATLVAGLLARHLGPTPVFPIAGAVLALSMAYGLTQREFRDFGAGGETVDKKELSADKGPSPAGR
jgi:MFS family permease